MAAKSNALATLLSPVTPHAFVHEYWGRKTLFVPGTESKIRELLGDAIGWDDYFEVADRLSRLRYDGRFERGVSLLCSPKALAHRDRTGGFLPLVLVEGDNAREYLDSGIPVTIPWVHWLHQGVGEFMKKLTTELVGLKDLMCVFATNPFQGSGVANHFDSFPTLHLQIIGRKRWRVSMTPEFLWPLRPGVETIGGRTDYLDLQGQRVGRALDASQLETIEVKPGDLIFLPAGTWHQAHPIDEDTLGLELVFTRLTTTDVLLGVLQDHLNTTECRYDPPLLLADETAPWSLPEEARQFFAARIEQLKAFVRNLEADDVNLQRVWKQKANGLIPHPDTRMRQPIRVTGTETGTEHTTRSAKRADVTPDTWLALSERGPIKAVFAADADGDRTYLYQQEAALCFEGTRAAHFAREIVRRQKQPLRAAEALSWESSPPFSWDVIKPVLQRLVDSGFLAVVG